MFKQWTEQNIVEPASDPKWYYGRYEKAESETSGQGEQAVLLFGRCRSDDTQAADQDVVGSQYPLSIGEQEFFVDLLFYHLKLRCFIVIDLKMRAFEPKFSG
ncbi:MAG: hypothetical protein C0392_14750 [Syntrophus sp. (in: bacteria)]|nr:hypothetical protein [Syntrophus sp. (in: bacteria)]